MVLNLNNNLTKLGHDVTIITAKHILDNKINPKGFSNNVFRINSIYLLRWPYSSLSSVSIPIDLGLKIKSIIKKGKFDIVHVQGHHYPICWIAIHWAHKLNIPCVLTSHGMWALEQKVMWEKTRLEDYFNRIIYSRLLKKTNSFIGLTDHITNFAKQIEKKDTNFYTIPNGTDTKIFKDNIKRKNEYREEFKIKNDSKVILFLGRLEPVKGTIEFANAVKKIIKNKKIEILIVGGGSVENRVKSILKGIERIHFYPWQSPQEIYKFFIASDIFVLPSRIEGLPLTLIEAMNTGLHIVYTPVGGIPEVMQDYPRKTLLKKVSSSDIENVLIDIISNYSSTYRIDEALNYARKFDWYNLAQDTIKVYSECLNHKKLL